MSTTTEPSGRSTAPESAATAPTPSRMPAWLPAFNKKVTNRIQGLWAPYLWPYVMICHVGRSSGKDYRSPVVAFRRGGKLYVNLLYGSEAQWVKNVVAAGGTDAIRFGRRIRLDDPEIITREDHSGPLPFGVRVTGRSTGILVLRIA